MFRRNRFSKRRYISSYFQTRYSLGQSGSGGIYNLFKRIDSGFLPFISRLDRKNARRLERKFPKKSGVTRLI